MTLKQAMINAAHVLGGAERVTCISPAGTFPATAAIANCPPDDGTLFRPVLIKMKPGRQQVVAVRRTPRPSSATTYLLVATAFHTKYPEAFAEFNAIMARELDGER